MNKQNWLLKGFTLIELLVVIAIIGILMAYATANFMVAQKQARDIHRQEAMAGIQTSLETYFTMNGEYPDTDPEIISALDSSTKPVDPQPSQSYDWSHMDSTSYCICATLEVAAKGNADGFLAGNQCSWNATGNLFCIQNRQ